MKRVSIIGGGAAGMLAAYSASLNRKAQVFLFEKNDRCGKKLSITGKGRCNITNAGDINTFMENIPHNGLFLHSALSQFNNYDIISLLNENGLKTKTERGGRVFPESDKATDVTAFFVGLMKKSNVAVKYGMAADSITKNPDGTMKILFKNGTSFTTEAVVLASGGMSYPKTGSEGDGYEIAKSLGHSVTKLYPALTALKVKDSFVKELSGLTIKNVAITVKDTKGNTVYSDFGEMLFTHFGVSGPVILSASSRITKRLDNENFSLLIDLKPALDANVLDKRLLKDFEKFKNKDLANSLKELLPKSLIPVVINAAGIEAEKKTNSITKAERRAIGERVKGLRLKITGTDGFEHAVITYGGVETSQINPKTMESKLIKGMYFAGEIIDVDAYTGGFNLQIAFSTGYVAGKNAAD